MSEQYANSPSVAIHLTNGPDQSLENFQIAKEDREQVKTFLAENSFLNKILQEGHAQAIRFFPKNRIFLELYTDRDDGEVVLLFIISLDGLEAKKALELMQELKNAWWYEAAPLTEDKLEIILRQK